MNRLFFTGDTHQGVDIGKFSNSRFKEGQSLDKSDIVVILGDAGFVWSYGQVAFSEEKYWREWLSNKPWTTFCTLGNHSNFDLIKTFPIVEFGGAPARKITDSIYYAETSYVFNLNGHKCLCINGADSMDKEFRTAGTSWWEDEIITEERIEKAKESIKPYNNKVDFVLSHTGGEEVCKFLGFNPTISDKRLTELLSVCDYKKHYCAHYHENKIVNEKTRILFDDIIEIY